MIIHFLFILAVQAEVTIRENFHGKYSIHILINNTERTNVVGYGHFCAFDRNQVKDVLNSGLGKLKFAFVVSWDILARKN